MITEKDCLKKYGPPQAETNMILFDVPTELEIGIIPKRIYCNKDIVPVLERTFRNLIRTGEVRNLITWDGCFNIRGRLHQKNAPYSLHSWGIAIDVNAAWNRYGHKSTLTPAFVKCFTDAGFEWGGNWKTLDAMHFQLAKLPD